MRVVVSAVAVWVVTLLLPGVVVEGPPGAMGSTLYEVLTFLAVGLVLALVDAVVRPIVKTLAFPLYVLTLGLFSVVVNAAMLEPGGLAARPDAADVHHRPVLVDGGAGRGDRVAGQHGAERGAPRRP
ncbi:hypothetical protein GCM10025868_24230 [Angustibacter aerolatus]|uniref:Uncharacterized protein n=1 Tax=Angustibacter aerolatus TaxID=1162965 RepID=A0ABQ6JG58_9ACTN|nr:phage holin family protein [Angustibacter aerolatus]GMA87173.1 hypothetical protein GCM10025868_24230 [Angustibacter aerolatus]